MGRSKRKPPADRQVAWPAEARPIEAATIAWMLTTLFTGVCELGAIAARVYLAWLPEMAIVRMLTGMLFLMSIVMGLVGVALLAVVLRTRILPPPLSVVIVSAVICAAPLAALAALAFV